MVKHYLVRAISAVAFFGLAVSVASAQTLYNADQNSNTGTSNTQTGAAVIGSAGDFWNSLGPVSNTNESLVNSTGSGGTVLTFSLVGTTSGSGASFYTDAGGTAMDTATTPLMKDYAYGGGSGGNLTETISGLTSGMTNLTGRTYTLIVYAAGDAKGQGGLVSLGGTGVSNTGASGTTTAVDRMLSNGQGDAYQVFTGTITGDSFTITEAKTTASGSNGIFNGLQLSIGAASVPEPATWISAAACLGLSMVVLRRRWQTT